MRIVEGAGGGYVACHTDLPGCVGQGESLGEALDALQSARVSWLTQAHESGKQIPLPDTMKRYSGKFIVRITSSLHEQLADAAGREGVSLNQYVLALLAEGIARRVNKQPSELEG